MTFLLGYFLFGAGMYIGMALNNRKSFTKASTASLIRGLLLCFIFWPIGLVAKITIILINMTLEMVEGNKNDTQRSRQR